VDALREDVADRRLRRPAEGRDTRISHEPVRENRRKRPAIRPQEMRRGHCTGFSDSLFD